MNTRPVDSIAAVKKTLDDKLSHEAARLELTELTLKLSNEQAKQLFIDAAYMTHGRILQRKILENKDYRLYLFSADMDKNISIIFNHWIKYNFDVETSDEFFPDQASWLRWFCLTKFRTVELSEEKMNKIMTSIKWNDDFTDLHVERLVSLSDDEKISLLFSRPSDISPQQVKAVHHFLLKRFDDFNALQDKLTLAASLGDSAGFSPLPTLPRPNLLKPKKIAEIANIFSWRAIPIQLSEGLPIQDKNKILASLSNEDFKDEDFVSQMLIFFDEKNIEDYLDREGQFSDEARCFFYKKYPAAFARHFRYSLKALTQATQLLKSFNEEADATIFELSDIEQVAKDRLSTISDIVDLSDMEDEETEQSMKSMLENVIHPSVPDATLVGVSSGLPYLVASIALNPISWIPTIAAVSGLGIGLGAKALYSKYTGHWDGITKKLHETYSTFSDKQKRIFDRRVKKDAIACIIAQPSYVLMDTAVYSQKTFPAELKNNSLVINHILDHWEVHTVHSKNIEMLNHILSNQDSLRYLEKKNVLHLGLINLIQQQALSATQLQRVISLLSSDDSLSYSHFLLLKIILPFFKYNKNYLDSNGNGDAIAWLIDEYKKRDKNAMAILESKVDEEAWNKIRTVMDLSQQRKQKNRAEAFSALSETEMREGIANWHDVLNDEKCIAKIYHKKKNLSVETAEAFYHVSPSAMANFIRKNNKFDSAHLLLNCKDVLDIADDMTELTRETFFSTLNHSIDLVEDDKVISEDDTDVVLSTAKKHFPTLASGMSAYMLTALLMHPFASMPALAATYVIAKNNRSIEDRIKQLASYNLATSATAEFILSDAPIKERFDNAYLEFQGLPKRVQNKHREEVIAVSLNYIKTRPFYLLMDTAIYSQTVFPKSYRNNEKIMKHIVDYWDIHTVQLVNQEMIHFVLSNPEYILQIKPDRLQNGIINIIKQGKLSAKQLVALIQLLRKQNQIDLADNILDSTICLFLKYNQDFLETDNKYILWLIKEAMQKNPSYAKFEKIDGNFIKAKNPILRALHENVSDDKWSIVGALYFNLKNKELLGSFLSRAERFPKKTETEEKVDQATTMASVLIGASVGSRAMISKATDSEMNGSSFGLFTFVVVAAGVFATGSVGWAALGGVLGMGLLSGLMTGVLVKYGTTYLFNKTISSLCPEKDQEIYAQYQIMKHGPAQLVKPEEIREIFYKSDKTGKDMRSNFYKMAMKVDSETEGLVYQKPLQAIINVHESASLMADNSRSLWSYVRKLVHYVERAVGLLVLWPYFWGFQATYNNEMTKAQSKEQADFVRKQNASQNSSSRVIYPGLSITPEKIFPPRAKPAEHPPLRTTTIHSKVPAALPVAKVVHDASELRSLQII